MPLLTTATEIASLTKHTFDAAEIVAVNLVIDLAEGELRGHVNRPLVPTAVVGERATADDEGTMYLRRSPIVSVQAIRYAGTTNPFTGAYEIVPGGLSLSGMATGSYDVDYTAGVRPEDSGALKAAVVGRVTRIVAKVHDDATGVSSLTQEGYNAAYLEEGFTEQELLLAGRQRRRTLA